MWEFLTRKESNKWYALNRLDILILVLDIGSFVSNALTDDQAGMIKNLGGMLFILAISIGSNIFMGRTER